MGKLSLPSHTVYATNGDDGPSNAAVEPRGRAMKNHFVAASGEFVGTFLFLYFAFATHLMAVDQTDAVALANRQNSAQTVVYISLGYGFSLLVTVWAFYRISGGLFNPAVSVLLFFSSLLWCFVMLEGEEGGKGREGRGGRGVKCWNLIQADNCRLRSACVLQADCPGHVGSSSSLHSSWPE
jgi:hypothetical protein